MTADNSTEKKPPKRRKWPRRLLFSFLGILLFMALLWAGMQTPWGKDRLTDLVARATAHTGSYQAKLEGVRGIVPFSMTVDRFTLSDEHGTWLIGHKTNISLNPWALLSGIIEVKWFRMENLSISRLPEPREDKSRKEERVDERESPPSLPHFMVNEIGINRIELAKAVAGTPMTYTLQSKVETVGPRIEARLSLKDLRREEDALRLKGTYDLNSGQIASRLIYQEAPGGLVSALAHLKDARGIRLNLQADGLLSGLKGHLKTEIGGYGQADLSFQLAVSEIISIAFKGRIEPEKGTLPPQVESALGDRVWTSYAGPPC
ncbi:MAG: hypothetical protein U5R49_25805 [Deltaproteobacteria bacterium]|nr:hypothetical protein [Deltaproteobacteria bacterium]